MFDFGILGINARNLHYIGKENPEKAVRLADNKIDTKVFLSQRGIPVPTTYAVIHTHAQLLAYDFSALPYTHFIIKPARGSRGRGILRVQKLKDHTPDSSTGSPLPRREQLFFTNQKKESAEQMNYFRLGDKIVTEAFLKTYCTDILEGKRSLQYKPDQILIEELLEPGEGFAPYCTHGLADIRLIIHKFIPVAAMLRIPTLASEGKANLDRGGVGIGVEVGSGQIQSMYLDGVVYTEDFPPPYSSFLGQQLPYREDILTWSSQIQYYVNLGYLAVDRVITDVGPKLLEINARPGLKIQLALQLPLKQRLQKLEGLKVGSPRKGVEIAQSLFTREHTGQISPTKIIPQSGTGELVRKVDAKKEKYDVFIQVDLERTGVWVDKIMAPYLPVSGLVAVYGDSGAKIPLSTWKKDTSLPPYHIILGRDAVSDWYIKPGIVASQIQYGFAPKSYQASELDLLKLLDAKLAQLASKLILSSYVRPTNFVQELDAFISAQGAYDPQFRYARPSEKKLANIRASLQLLQEEFFRDIHLRSSLSVLFAERLAELSVKCSLLEAYRKQDLAQIRSLQEQYRGERSSSLAERAVQMTTDLPSDRALLGPVLGRKKVKKLVETYLAQQGWDQVRVVFTPETFARMSVKRVGEEMILSISSGSTFRKYDLYAALAHELVHIRRYTAALQTPWQLLRRGTARSFIDEEGLALVTAERELPSAYEKTSLRKKYLFVGEAMQKSFRELAAHIQTTEGEKSLLSLFKTVYRLKRGIQDTGVVDSGAVCLQDTIYAQGYQRLHDRQEQGGDIEQLMVGKIKIEDLKYF